jgi:hypothetical protein
MIGFSGSLAVADAQTPSPSAAGTAFDGTYALGSSTRVNESYFAVATNRIGQCRDYPTLRPLMIVNGQARRYSKEGLLTYEGTVEAHGELTMRNVPTPQNHSNGPGYEVIVTGRIDRDGTLRARMTGYNCSYDLVWRRVSK